MPRQQLADALAAEASRPKRSAGWGMRIDKATGECTVWSAGGLRQAIILTPDEMAAGEDAIVDDLLNGSIVEADRLRSERQAEETELTRER